MRAGRLLLTSSINSLLTVFSSISEGRKTVVCDSGRRSCSIEDSSSNGRASSDQPCPAVFAPKTVEKSERAQCSFLHNVLRILIVAHKESRQVVSRVEMRQNLPLELGQARGLGKTEHVSLLSIIKHKTAKA